MTRDKIKDVTNAAVAGFWGHVKKSLPHVSQDAMDPVVARRLAEAAEAAIVDWMSRNDRDEWTEIGSIIEIRAKSPLFKPELAFVWSSDHETFRTHAEVRMLSWESRHYREGSPRVGQPDPGLVRLTYDLNLGKWFWNAIGDNRVEIEIRPIDDAALKSAWVDPQDHTQLVVSEILGNEEPELMRIKMPAAIDDVIGTRNAIRRLVAELNLLHLALRR